MYSDHARVRMQQRGVPPLIVEWLLQYGAQVYDHRGARIRYFDKKSRKRIRRAVGDIALRRLHELFDCYAVVAEDGTVVTVGHSYGRIRKH
jgi:hypothetical protein